MMTADMKRKLAVELVNDAIHLGILVYAVITFGWTFLLVLFVLNVEIEAK